MTSPVTRGKKRTYNVKRAFKLKYSLSFLLGVGPPQIFMFFVHGAKVAIILSGLPKCV